jgi:hypothetical protein
MSEKISIMRRHWVATHQVGLVGGIGKDDEFYGYCPTSLGCKEHILWGNKSRDVPQFNNYETLSFCHSPSEWGLKGCLIKCKILSVVFIYCSKVALSCSIIYFTIKMSYGLIWWWNFMNIHDDDDDAPQANGVHAIKSCLPLPLRHTLGLPPNPNIFPTKSDPPPSFYDVVLS